jgi:hypothetical protein
MHLNRKQDLSVYYFIKDLFSSTPFVNIEDGYLENGVTIPTVAVESLDIETVPFELGNSKRLNIRTWDVDIYALNKTQRDEFSYQVMDALEDSIPVWDYDGGFPPTVLTQLGCMEPDNIRIEIIRILPELVDKYYYRATVSFTAIYNKF